VRAEGRTVGRDFAIATKEVTVAQFRRFLETSTLCGGEKLTHHFTKKFSPADDGPIINVTWYEAAQYCRWLSEEEGVPENQMCYPNVTEIEKCKNGKPLTLPKDYLSRTGYRLPTEEEWEYACRARTTTRWSFGEDERVIGHYGRPADRSEPRADPVGTYKPSDIGLFDAHGNVWEWCETVRPGGGLLWLPALRGGSFESPPSSCCSGYRKAQAPNFAWDNNGFRIARTLSPGK
jgi:formylglycine-generating enzyme required for sulfatase activity